MKRYLFIVAGLFLISAVFAQSKQTVTKALVNYQIKNMGINTNGAFTGVQANINFDQQQLAGSTINAVIDAATINSDNTMRDNHLKSDEYFDVAHYPHITMKSVSFKHKNGNNFTGIFNLTIKDKTKIIEVPFTYTDNNATASFKGSFKINRRDFNVGGSSMVLADLATVNIEIETSK